MPNKNDGKAIVPCKSCGQKNRVEIAAAAMIVRHLPSGVRCGRCKTGLSVGDIAIAQPVVPTVNGRGANGPQELLDRMADAMDAARKAKRFDQNFKVTR
jgi:hypothetical protein